MLNVHAGAARLGRRCWIVNAVGAILLLGAARLSAQTVLIDESFEAIASFPLTYTTTGWMTTNETAGGSAPGISTARAYNGSKCVWFPRYTYPAISPVMDVSRTDSVILTCYVSQVSNTTYVATEKSASNDWQNDFFDVYAEFDGGIKTLLFRDYGLADGYVGSYNGTTLYTEKVGGVANGEWYAYELKINTKSVSTLRLRFRWWTSDGTNPLVRKGYLDTVKVVTVPVGTVMVIR